MHPVGMQPDLKPPSKAQMHELRVLLSLAGFEVVEVAGSIHQRGAYLGRRDRCIWLHARRRNG
jgi:hypothetical protein